MPAVACLSVCCQGTIRHGDRLTFRLEFHPVRETSLDGTAIKVGQS